MRECDGDGARARADVENIRRGGGIEFGLRHFGEDGFDQVFSFGPRDEDSGCDAQREAVKLLLTGDVLDGFVGEAALDCGFVRSMLGIRQGAVGIGVKLGASDAERMQQQEKCVAGCVGAKVWRCVKLASGAGVGFY